MSDLFDHTDWARLPPKTIARRSRSCAFRDRPIEGCRKPRYSVSRRKTLDPYKFVAQRLPIALLIGIDVDDANAADTGSSLCDPLHHLRIWVK